MKRQCQDLFDYISFLWTTKGKPDVKKVLAMYLAYNFGSNFSFAVKKWSEGKSLDGLSNSLMIEAGLIAALLSLSSFFSFKDKQLDSTTQPQNQNDSQNAQ